VYTGHLLLEFEKLTETLLEWGVEIFAFHATDRVSNGKIAPTTKSACSNGSPTDSSTSQPEPSSSPQEWHDPHDRV
jgi:hypothetical protein